MLGRLVKLVWLLLVLVLASVGCTRPCDRLAERTCERRGASSQECLEMKNLAGRSGDEDQAHCREALSILEAAAAEGM